MKNWTPEEVAASLLMPGSNLGELIGQVCWVNEGSSDECDVFVFAIHAGMIKLQLLESGRLVGHVQWVSLSAIRTICINPVSADSE
jgi:hypothetical protein